MPVLAAAGIGVEGETLFWSTLPDEPAACVAVYETGGEPPDTSKAGIEARNPRLQVLCRAEDYEAAMAKAEAAYAALVAVRGEIVGSGAVYHSIRPLQEPFAIGKDDAGRSLISCNYSVSRSPP